MKPVGTGAGAAFVDFAVEPVDVPEEPVIVEAVAEAASVLITAVET